MKKEKIALNDLQNQPKNYEFVIIGTPIWAFTMSTPIRTFLEQYKADLTKVAFFSTSDSTPGDKTFSYMQEVCGKQPQNTLSITKKDLTTHISGANPAVHKQASIISLMLMSITLCFFYFR
jgi:multimeric flavodoxin WrbA